MSGTIAQSTRPQPKTGEKANKRPVEPAATPTPLPVDVPISDDKITVDDGEIIKVTTQLVSVPVRVMDKRGRFIGGLTKENFKVTEDGKDQEIGLFSNEHEPFTVALVLDMSYSTTFKISEIQNAAIAFIDQLRPNDKVMVISFDEEVHVLCDATNDRQTIYRAIKSTKIATGTSLYEAVALVMNKKLRSIQGRKAIILFSDGVDTTSRQSTYNDNVSDSMELDALIYVVRYDTFADVQKMKNGSIIKKPPPMQIPGQDNGGILGTITQSGGLGTPSGAGTSVEEYEKAKEYLGQLAFRTGGRLYEATTLTNLADAYSKIASELREFYSLGYYPKEDRTAGKKTSIKVKVDREGVVVRTRDGYIVPKKTKISGSGSR
ncbi:MAG: VWA domain-containing protein [Chloracidobacterium sp.]|nr:VWA domain-containing protein [Chloracidobacterium sp.]